MAVSEAQALAALRKYKRDLLRLPGAVSAGLAREGGEWVIRVDTATGAAPPSLDGVRVVVRVRSVRRPLTVTAEMARRRWRPAPIGVSIGTDAYTFHHPVTGWEVRGCATGSSGFYAMCGKEVYMVTAGHLWWPAVYQAWEEKYDRLPGPDEVFAPPELAGLPVYQPSPADGGSAADLVGRLFAYNISPGGAAEADACLVRMEPGLVIPVLADDSRTGWVGDAAVGQPVTAFGRTSGTARGVVTCKNADVWFEDPDAGQYALVRDALIVEPGIAAWGDSGGPVLNAAGDILGIITAGSDEDTIVSRAAAALAVLENAGPVRVWPALPLAVAAAVGIGLAASVIKRKERGR